MRESRPTTLAGDTFNLRARPASESPYTIRRRSNLTNHNHTSAVSRADVDASLVAPERLSPLSARTTARKNASKDRLPPTRHRENSAFSTPQRREDGGWVSGGAPWRNGGRTRSAGAREARGVEP